MPARTAAPPPSTPLPAALAAVGVTAYADSAYHGVGPTIRAPFRAVRYDRATRTFVSHPLPHGQKALSRTHSALRTPSQRANPDRKNSRTPRKTRSSPTHATTPVNTVPVHIPNN